MFKVGDEVICEDASHTGIPGLTAGQTYIVSKVWFHPEFNPDLARLYLDGIAKSEGGLFARRFRSAVEPPDPMVLQLIAEYREAR